MPIGTGAGTFTTVHVKDAGYSLPESDDANVQSRYLRMAARRAFRSTLPLSARLEPPYVVGISPTAPWLPRVERRIESSTLPKEYEGLVSTEWLREEVGQAAIRFFQNTADVLPGEPYIYASQSGALVAEFSASNGSLTTVISPSTITLFGVKANQPDAPMQVTLRRGSNSVREDLKVIVHAITGSHGQMGAAT
jgi:hypothetical protein